jgi:hypothetical protein
VQFAAPYARSGAGEWRQRLVCVAGMGRALGIEWLVRGPMHVCVLCVCVCVCVLYPGTDVFDAMCPHISHRS